MQTVRPRDRWWPTDTRGPGRKDRGNVAITLAEMLSCCFDGAVVCLTQDTYKEKNEARRMVLLYLPDRQKMTVGVLRTLAEKEIVSVRTTGIAVNPEWKRRVEINMVVPEALICQASRAVRTGALMGESWIGIPEIDRDGSEYTKWERDDIEIFMPPTAVRSYWDIPRTKPNSRSWQKPFWIMCRWIPRFPGKCWTAFPASCICKDSGPPHPPRRMWMPCWLISRGF